MDWLCALHCMLLRLYADRHALARALRVGFVLLLRQVDGVLMFRNVCLYVDQDMTSTNLQQRPTIVITSLP